MSDPQEANAILKAHQNLQKVAGLAVYLVKVDLHKNGKTILLYACTKRPNVVQGFVLEFQGVLLQKDESVDGIKNGKDLVERLPDLFSRTQELIYPLDRIESIENLSYQKAK